MLLPYSGQVVNDKCGDSRYHMRIGTGYFNKAGCMQNMSILHCISYVEMMYVDAKFNLPNFTTAGPLQPAEETAKFLSDSPSVTSSWTPVTDYPAAKVGDSTVAYYGYFFFNVLVDCPSL